MVAFVQHTCGSSVGVIVVHWNPSGQGGYKALANAPMLATATQAAKAIFMVQKDTNAKKNTCFAVTDLFSLT